MELIRQLAEQMEDEICDSKHYAKWAVEVKDKYPELAETLYTISLQEEKHMQMLHDAAEKIISGLKQKNVSISSDMLAIYDYLHKRQIKERENTFRYQELYKK